MRILIITQGFPPIIGGVSYSLNCLYKYLKKNHHEITIFIFPYDLKSKIKFPKEIINVLDYKRYIIRNCFKIIRGIINFFYQILHSQFSFKKKIKTLFYYVILIKYLIYIVNSCEIIKSYDKIHNFDLILAYDSAISAQISFLLKKKIKKKYITVAHGNDISNHYIELLTSLILRDASKIIVRSKFIQELVINLYKINEKKIIICPDGINEENFKVHNNKLTLREELKLKKDHFYILSVGRLNLIRKGFDLVLKSLKELRDININNITYILIGVDHPKVRNWLIELANKYGVDKNFKLLVNVNDNLRNKYYKASDIFVMPSRDLRKKGRIEGFGNVFIEAGYFGLPSIGSNTGGIPDAIENGKSGFLINNFNELIEKIKLLYENQNLRLKMGNYAQKRVLKNFLWDKLYLSYFNVFKYTIKPKK